MVKKKKIFKKLYFFSFKIQQWIFWGKDKAEKGCKCTVQELCMSVGGVALVLGIYH
jgi:hypothetical protein